MSWENFIFGADSMQESVRNTLLLMSQLQLFWGFVGGFLLATLVHGFLSTGSGSSTFYVLMRNTGVLLNNTVVGLQKGLNKNANVCRLPYNSCNVLTLTAKITFSAASLMFLTVMLIIILK